MSDSTRKDFTEQAKETVTPDSQKSTLDKASETVTGKADNLAGSLQPQEEKSTAQKIGDSTKDTSNQAGEQGQSILGKAQETLSGAAQSISDTFSGDQKK